MYCGNQPGLGAIAPLAVATSIFSGISFGRSDRYLGPGQITKDPDDGPLMGTLQGFLQRAAMGETQVLHEWNDARKRVRGWQAAWVHELPKVPLNTAQLVTIKALDPSWVGASVMPVTQGPGTMPVSHGPTAGPGQTVTNPKTATSPTGSANPNGTQPMMAGVTGSPLVMLGILGAVLMVATGGGPRLGGRRRR